MDYAWPAPCRRGCCAESHQVKHREAGIPASSKGALGLRLQKGTQGSPGEAAAAQSNFSLLEKGISNPTGQFSGAGQLLAVLWWVPGHFWVSLLTDDKSREGQFRNTNDRMDFCPWVFKRCLFLNRKGSHVIFQFQKEKTPQI